MQPRHQMMPMGHCKRRTGSVPDDLDGVFSPRRCWRWRKGGGRPNLRQRHLIQPLRARAACNTGAQQTAIISNAEGHQRRTTNIHAFATGSGDLAFDRPCVIVGGSVTLSGGRLFGRLRCRRTVACLARGAALFRILRRITLLRGGLIGFLRLRFRLFGIFNRRLCSFLCLRLLRCSFLRFKRFLRHRSFGRDCNRGNILTGDWLCGSRRLCQRFVRWFHRVRRWGFLPCGCGCRRRSSGGKILERRPQRRDLRIPAALNQSGLRRREIMQRKAMRGCGEHNCPNGDGAGSRDHCKALSVTTKICFAPSARSASPVFFNSTAGSARSGTMRTASSGRLIEARST